MNLHVRGSQLFYYLSEMTFLYLLFTYLYVFQSSYAPFLPFLGMVTAGGFILIILTSVGSKAVSSMKVILMIGFLVMIGWISGVPLWQAFLLTLAISWSIYSNLKEIERSGLSFVFLGLIGATVYSLIAPSTELKSMIFLIPGIQLLLVLCSRAFQQLKGEGTKRTAQWTTSAIAILMVTVASSVFLITLFREAILTFISYVLGGLSYVLGLPIYWLTLLITMNSGEEDLTSFKEATQKDVSITTEQGQNTIQPSTFSFEPILYTLLAVIALVVLIFIIRKKLDFSQFQAAPITFKTEDSPLHAKTLRQTKRSTPPTNEIRKSTFYLEKQAIKYGYHREKGEPLSNWLKRLPGYSEEQKQLAGIYEKVRYADENVPEKEVLQYKKGMKNLVKKMKDSKKRKENKEQ